MIRFCISRRATVLENICKFFLSRDHSWNQNLHLHIKFHRIQMIQDWDVAIKPFWKWQLYAILNLWNLVFWSRDLCLSIIPLLHTKFRVNWTINHWDTAKNDFHYGGRPPFWMCNILIFCHVTVLGIKICVRIPKVIEIGWFLAEI